MIRIRSHTDRLARRLGVGPQLAWDTGWSFTLRATSTGLAFLSTVLLARFLGPEGYGVYSFAYSLVWILAVPAEAGLPNLIVRETARGMAQDRPDIVRGAWQWAGQVVAVISLALVLVAGPIILLGKRTGGSVEGITLAWALALVPLLALGNLRGAALRGLKRVVAGQLPEFVIRPALFASLLAGAGLVFGPHLSASQAMSLQVWAALGAFVIGAWMLRRDTPRNVSQARPFVEPRSWLASSLVFALISGFQIINKQVSTIIVGLFEPPGQVGIYRVAVQVATLASFGLLAVNTVVAPRFASLYSLGNMDRLQRLVTASARVILAVNIFLTALFVVLGKPFLTLVFGPAFAAAYLPLLILLVGQMVNSATGAVSFLLNMTGHERQTAYGMAAAAGLNVVLNFILVPVWGIEGAAAATSISMIGWNVLLWLAVRNRMGISSLPIKIGARAVKADAGPT